MIASIRNAQFLLRSSSPFWVISGAAGNAVLTVIGFRIIGDIAGAGGLGQGVLLHGVALLISSLIAIPLSQAVGRYFFDAKTPEGHGRLLLASGILAFCGYIVGIHILFLLWLFNVLEFLGFTLLLITLAMEMLRAICTAWLQSNGDFSQVALAQILDSGLRPIFVLLVVGVNVTSGVLVLLAYMTASVLSVSVLIICVLKKVTWSSPVSKDFKKLLRYSVPLSGNGLFGWVANAGDRYIVAAVLGSNAAGVYVAASALGGRLSLMLGTIVESYFRRRIYLAITERNLRVLKKVIKRWFSSVFCGGIVLIICVVFFMPYVQQYFLPVEFRDGSEKIIVISFVASWLIAFGFIPQRINYALESTVKVAAVEVLGTATMITGVFFLGSIYGMGGAILGMAISALSRLLLSLALAVNSMSAVSKDVGR